jgi:DNA-binding CsgD family transcriptional regulator
MEEGTAAEFGLFGREEELRVLSDVLDAGGCAVATGEPGVGKSSLLTVADQLGQRRGRRVLSVTPRQFDRGLPFAGLAELVAQVPAGADRDLPEPQRRGLAVALQRAEPDGLVVDALAVPLAVQGLLTHLCEAEPVALIIDDLQWLDQASLGSLGFALRRITVAPDRLSVLIGTRPEGAGVDLIRSLPAPRHDFTLTPLPEWAVGQLLRTRLGARWTPPVSAGVARVSSGNPFLALMIAQAMQSDLSQWHWSGQGGHEPVFPVPPSLVDLLGEKVTLLPPEARDVLLLVSAAGRLTVGQLQEIVEDAELVTALEAAADWDVATVGAGAVVGFTHPLLASAIYDAAPAAQRRRAHRVLSERLDDPVERARHRWRSITAPDEAVAEQLERAADISRGRGAQVLAGELMEAAALATPSSTDASVSIGRWLRAVDTYTHAGDELAAHVALDKGSSLAGDSEHQAQVLVRQVRLAGDISTARSVAEEALRLAPGGSEVRAEILQILGVVCRVQGHGTRALEVTQLAITEAAALKRVDVELRALNERVEIERHWVVGHSHQETLQEIEHLAERASLDPRSAELAWVRSFFADWDDEAAETHVRNGIAWAVEAGRYGDLSSLYISLVLVLIRASKVREAQAALEDANRSGAWTAAAGTWSASAGPQEDMAQILVKEYAGDLDGAREWTRHALARPEIRGSAYWRGGFLAQHGFIESSARNWQAALEPLRELAEIFASTEMVDLEALLWPVDYADAALQVGALPDVDVAISLLRRQGESGRSEATVAAKRCQALLTAARGDVEEALHELVAVVDRQGAECPFEAARSRLALGQVYRRAGYKGLATEALNAAASAFDDLGIPRWAERARDEARRAGLHPTTSTLTQTERRVAELVAAGHSNQETAAELFISVKTVEANLTRIYRKLSVRSRTELANRVNAADGRQRE